jgi:hypothetical protein
MSVYKSGQQRHYKRAVEITHKMHQGEGENSFYIRVLIQCGHRHSQDWGKKEKGMIGKAQWRVKLSLLPETRQTITGILGPSSPTKVEKNQSF